MSIGEYGKLSIERKKMQAEGVMPEWFSTGGWQLFKDRYLYQADNPKQQYERIAATLSKHTPDPEEFKTIFFDLLWKGWLSPSTPVLSNTGTERGLPVSCAGNYTSDNIYDIFDSRKEVALLTKHGFGTASYLGDLRGRGDTISVGGKAAGLMPVIDLQSSDMEYVSQGGVRRGSWAGYLDISHKDFFEVDNKLATKPDGLNIGYVWYDSDTLKMKTDDEDMTKRWQSFLKTKMITGKGYLWFADKANRKAPQMYKDKGLKVRTSQLCVAPETLIYTDRGHEVISELVGEKVNVWNGKEFSEVEIVQTSKASELVTVNTSDGFSLDCTPHHKFYIQEGGRRDGAVIEVAASQLKSGDKLIKVETPVIEGVEVLDKPWQNGFFTGDGCTVGSKSRVYLYGEKQSLVNNFTDVTSVYSQEDRTYFYVGGLKDKFFIPDATYTIESRVKWFEGLLDSDGCVARNGKSQTLQIASAEEGFLESVQLMLQTLGVQAKVVSAVEGGSRSLPANDGSGERKLFNCRKAVRLLIGGMGIVKLVELGLSPKRLEITKHIPNRDARGFVRVSSVEYKGRVDATYCFTEPKRHMGVFNGLLTGQCNEISLMCDKDHTFTCVLSSMNLAKWDEWKDTDAVYYATIFLDAVCQEFLNKAKNIKGLEKAVAFTKKSRALGLGVAGYHTYLIDSGIPFNSFQAQHFNRTMSKKLKDDSLKASQWLAGVWGEPEWCKGYGVANTHRLAIAPTKSTALIMGGVSEGINPVVAYVFTQRSAGGEISRVDPSLLKVMKAKGVYNKKNIEEIADAMGSVQGVSWLSDEEKEVFKTAFEIDQYAILKQAEDRGKNLCQWQSLNLFFSAKEDEGHISKVHQYAVESEDILGLYYVYSMADVQASNDKDECVACQ